MRGTHADRAIFSFLLRHPRPSWFWSRYNTVWQIYYPSFALSSIRAYSRMRTDLLRAVTIKYLASLAVHDDFSSLANALQSIIIPLASRPYRKSSRHLAAPPATSYVRPSRITHFRPASRRPPESELKATPDTFDISFRILQRNLPDVIPRGDGIVRALLI